MKQQDVFNKIGKILNELNEQYDYLKEDTNQLNELELELFVANAQFLKDHSEILRKINAQSAAAEKPAEIAPIITAPPVFVPPVLPPPIPAPVDELPPPPIEKLPPPAPVVIPEPPRPDVNIIHEEKFFEPVVQQLKPVLNAPPPKVTEPPYVSAEAQEEAETEPETIRHELFIDDADSWEDEDESELYEEEPEIDVIPEPEPEPEVVASTPVYEPEPEPVIIPEKPVDVRLAYTPPPVTPPVEVKTAEEDKKETTLTINQRMSDQMGEKKESALQPITDLKSSITLNDKLLYVQDLFNGYSLAYSEAIEILNRFNSFEEAERFLNANYVAKNNWQNKPATVQKFYSLLNRRYA